MEAQLNPQGGPVIAAQYDIKFKRGDDYTLFGRVRTRVWDSGLEEWIPGAYRDITGYTGLAQCRLTTETPAILFSFTVTLGNQVTAPGSFFVEASAADTEDLTVSQCIGVWDLQWTTDLGKKYTYVEGAVILDPDTSRT